MHQGQEDCHGHQNRYKMQREALPRTQSSHAPKTATQEEIPAFAGMTFTRIILFNFHNHPHLEHKEHHSTSAEHSKTDTIKNVAFRSCRFDLIPLLVEIPLIFKRRFVILFTFIIPDRIFINTNSNSTTPKAIIAMEIGFVIENFFP